MTTVFFTICSKNYLAYALTLRRSVLDCYNGNADFRIVLADELDSDTKGALRDVDILEARHLGIETFYDMAFRYTVVELNTAIKADCFLRLFSESDTDRIVYFDPDILVFRRLEDVDGLLNEGADAVVTPHITHPLEDGLSPDDQRHLQTGVYNLGFCAFRRTEASLSFLEWWARKLKRGCRVDLENGIFVDQKYLDLLTCFVERAAVLRHPGYNVAYWNLPHRLLTRDGDTWRVNDLPLVFFHFSGVEPAKPHSFSRHQNRYASTDDIGDAKVLVTQYIALLHENGHESFRRADYKYGRTSDGITIVDEMRRVYAEKQSFDSYTYDQVFGSSYALFTASSKRVPRFPGVPFTTLMYEIWRGRRDLQRTFPLTSAGDQLRYLKWFVNTANKEHNIDPSLILPLKEAVKRAKVRPHDKMQMVSNWHRFWRPVRSALLRIPGLQRVYRLLPVGFRMRLNRYLFGFRTSPLFQQRALIQPDLVISRVDPANAPGATVVGFLRAESGVGEAGRRTYKALKSAGYNVVAVAVRSSEFEEAEDVLEQELSHHFVGRHVILQLNADNTLGLDSLVDERDCRGRYKIGIWAWELPRFPAVWKPAFERVDEIWAPSQFVQHSLLQATDKRVLVMPHPVPIVSDSGTFDRRYFGIREDAIVVLVTMDFNSFVARKNPLAAIEAVRRASRRLRNIQLVVKTHGRGSFEDARSTLSAALELLENAVLVDRVLTRPELDGLQSCCDVYISLHRAEGFGLNIAECMAKAKLVIATNYSGNRDFLDTTCGAPVRFSMRPVAAGNYPHATGQWWAEPDVEHAAELLARAVEDADWRLSLGRAAQERIANDFSCQSVGTKMRLRLEQIDAEIAARLS